MNIIVSEPLPGMYMCTLDRLPTENSIAAAQYEKKINYCQLAIACNRKTDFNGSLVCRYNVISFIN